MKFINFVNGDFIPNGTSLYMFPSNERGQNKRGKLHFTTPFFFSTLGINLFLNRCNEKKNTDWGDQPDQLDITDHNCAYSSHLEYVNICGDVTPEGMYQALLRNCLTVGSRLFDPSPQ